MPNAPIKILFISREKQDRRISPVVQAQADSLNELVDISIFSIKGRDWRSYFKGMSALRKYLKSNSIDLIHAHYSYIGMISGLATRKPIVVSLMGSDIEDFWFGRVLIRIFAKLPWSAVIVKSERSKDRIKLKKAIVIPNGVSLGAFQAIPKEKAREKLSFEKNKNYVLFLSHPGRKEKNYKLAAESCVLGTGSWDVELLALHDIPHHDIPLYLSAADVLLLTSFFEGSPNAIKEAMACNCPIVSTDVGDVKELIGDTEGCFITSFDPEDVASKIKSALEFGKRTLGREAVQHLDSEIIVERLVEVYKSIIK